MTTISADEVNNLCQLPGNVVNVLSLERLLFCLLCPRNPFVDVEHAVHCSAYGYYSPANCLPNLHKRQKHFNPYKQIQSRIVNPFASKAPEMSFSCRAGVKAGAGARTWAGLRVTAKG